MLTDLDQLVLMFGNSTEQKANQYKETHTSVVNDVLSLDTNTSDDPTFLFMFLSMKKPYADSSELSKIAENVGAMNCIGVLDPDNTRSTSSVQVANILDYDNTYGIDYILIRGTISDTSTAQSQYDAFLDIDPLYSNLSAVSDGKVYVIDTDVLSGPLDYVGYVCIAKALGMDIGDLDPAQLVEDFDDEYGFSYDKTEFVFNIGTV